MTVLRLKTEWCKQTMHGMECDHPRCFFAHSEHELATLGDRQKMGKLDLRTFKRCPCLSLLSTGACPFGDRCTDIHDVRVANHDITAWLKHYERNTLSRNGSLFSSHIDISKTVQQSIQQKAHPYGIDCSLMDSYLAFDAHVLNSYHEDSKRHIRFNTYLDVTPMSPSEREKVLKVITPQATVRKFEPEHSYQCLGKQKTIKVKIVATHQLAKCDDYILDIIFKDTGGVSPTYQRVALLGLDYEPTSGKITSNGYGRAFYIYDHPDQDVHQLIVDVVNADRKNINLEDRKKAFKHRFESILRHFQHSSGQMPMVPENLKEVRDVVYTPVEKSDSCIAKIWKSFADTMSYLKHSESSIDSKSTISTFSKLRSGNSIDTSISKIPQLNSKEENRLGEVLDYEGWELVMKVCAAT